MKNTAKCPKCNGNNIVLVEGKSLKYGAGSVVLTGPTYLNLSPIDRYICLDCGYVEYWASKSSIEKIEKSNLYKKVKPVEEK